MLLVCLFVCPSVRSSVCYQTCESDILKTHESILMPFRTSRPRSTLSMKRSKKIDFEAFSTLLSRVAFLVLQKRAI